MGYNFYGDGKCYLGVELEMDTGGETYDNGDAIIGTVNLNRGDHAFYKDDCSLWDGWEIISHPCTLEYHKNHFGWDKLIGKANELGYETGRYSESDRRYYETAGLHVHISRTAFGEYTPDQNYNIAKMALIVEKFPNEVFKLSRRSIGRFKEWSNLRETTDFSRLLYEVNQNYGGKSSAVNFGHSYTVEIRLFASTLNYNTFMGNLEFVQLLVNVATTHSVDEIQNMTWDEFTGKAIGYKFGFFLHNVRKLVAVAA